MSLIGYEVNSIVQLYFRALHWAESCTRSDPTLPYLLSQTLFNFFFAFVFDTVEPM